MHAARAGQAHEVDGHVVVAGVAERAFHLRIRPEGAIGDSAVDFHQILIDNAPGSDVEVAHLRVSHLAFRKAYVLSAGLQLRVGILCDKRVHERSRCVEYGIVLLMVTYAISVKDNQ